jgi:hypothetical protein
MGGKQTRNRTVLKELIVRHKPGVKCDATRQPVRRIANRHPLPQDLEEKTPPEATEQLAALAEEHETEPFNDKLALKVELWPTAPDWSVIWLHEYAGPVVAEFRLRLPEELVPDLPHKDAVEAVAEIVERADPPTHVEVYIPKPADHYAGFPHVMFNPKETAPTQNRYLPTSDMVEFIRALKQEVNDAV